MAQRKELAEVKRLLQEYPGSNAGDIAEYVGLVDTMGDYDKAVDYVRAARRRMRKAGEQDRPSATDAELLEDLERLLEIRQGRMSKSAQRSILMLYCYWSMRSSAEIDLSSLDTAIKNTYGLNKTMKNPLDPAEELKAAEIAIEYYDRSIDPKKNELAAKRGFQNAGLNYSVRNLIELFEITEEEERALKYIKRPACLPKERCNHEN